MDRVYNTGTNQTLFAQNYSDSLFAVVGTESPDYSGIAWEKAVQLYSANCRQVGWLSNQALLNQLEKMLYYTLRFNAVDAESLTRQVIVQALDVGIGVVLGKLTPVAGEAYHRARQVWAETHRVKGFARFWPTREVNHTLVGKAEFHHHIEDLVLTYFQKRYTGERIYLLKGTMACYLSPDKSVAWVPWDSLGLTIDEGEFARLWETYYDSQTIHERTNKKLARKHIPKKLWSWVPEGEKLV